MQYESNSSVPLRADLSHFTGSEKWYRHVLQKSFLYTEGVQFFCEQAGAYWFLDILATEVFPLQMNAPFLVIELHVASNGKIQVTDGNDQKVWSKHIPFTDAPQGVWRFFLTDNVCMLPSEY